MEFPFLPVRATPIRECRPRLIYGGIPTVCWEYARGHKKAPTPEQSGGGAKIPSSAEEPVLLRDAATAFGGYPVPPQKHSPSREWKVPGRSQPPMPVSAGEGYRPPAAPLIHPSSCVFIKPEGTNSAVQALPGPTAFLHVAISWTFCGRFTMKHFWEPGCLCGTPVLPGGEAH